MERKLFGTDGVRGVANVYPITAEMCLKIGASVASVLRKSFKGGRHRIVIGKDTRVSGYMIENAIASGIVSMGVDAVFVGPVPTPAVAHLTRSLNADAGIVISASHNPAEQNGIKLFSSDGFKLPDEVEHEIETLAMNGGISTENLIGENLGKAYRIKDARGRYTEFAKSSIKSASLMGFNMVLDCANGAAYQIAPEIFRELGAEVTVINTEPDGLNINKDCGALHPEKVAELVKETKADIGICLDGDADRLIVCDEDGVILDGDKIIAMNAIDMKERDMLKNNTVVGTVMSNIGFDKAMEKEGINVVKTDVGDRYVMKELQDNDYVLGGEQSGHIIFLNYATTGDGIISALKLLDIMRRKRQPLSELAKCMETYPQVLVNVKVTEKKPFDEMVSVKKLCDEVEQKLAGEGRLLLRYSGTEKKARVMIEGKDQAEIERMANEIAEAIKKEVGE